MIVVHVRTHDLAALEITIEGPGWVVDEKESVCSSTRGCFALTCRTVELAAVVAAWPELPEASCAGNMAMVDGASK
jgi:hypothetical protein